MHKQYCICTIYNTYSCVHTIYSYVYEIIKQGHEFER